MICVVVLFATVTSLLDISHGKEYSPQQLVDAWIAERAAGVVAAAIVSPEDTNYYFSRKNKNHVLPNENTIFEIGSITKGFTGLLLADQVMMGNVFLNDTLAKLLTDWPGRFLSPTGNLSLLELATHSSGLPRSPGNLDEHENNVFANYTKKDLYEWLDKAKPFQRGNFLYSNAGVGILGHALAVKAGMEYNDLLRERVLTPLGLTDTTLTLSTDQWNRITPGYDAQGELVSSTDFDVLAPAGALKSSASELVHLIQVATSIHENKMQIDQMFRFATERRGITDRETTTIGLCWDRMLLGPDSLVFYHMGSTYGYNVYVGWELERQLGVVVAASITALPNNKVENLAIDLFKLRLQRFL